MPPTDLPTPTSSHQLFAYRAKLNPDSAWVYYPEPVTAEKYRCLTYKGADALLSHLAAQYIYLLPKVDETTISKTAPKSIPKPPMVVATLVSNTVQALLTGLAAQRLGHAYMHISPLNSDIGIISLLHSVDAKVLISDETYFDRAAKLATQGDDVRVIRMIEFDPIDELNKGTKSFNFDISTDEGANCALILHTSGTSSSAPKPIWWPNKGVMHIAPLFTQSVVLSTGLV
jgi:hypothetical protein